MNEELQNTLASVLEKSMEAAEKTGQWALDMAPELIEQYLILEFWSAFIMVVISIFIFLVGSLFAKKLINENKKERKSSWLWDVTEFQHIDDLEMLSTPGVFAIMCEVIVLISASVMFFTGVYTMLFITIAPEIYLIKNLL